MRSIKTKRFRLYHGDNLKALRLLADNSVDSVVTDPPYGLGKEPDPYAMLRQWYKNGHYKHKNKKGFLGKEWDAFVPQPILWKEVYRVLKPGGHVLSFFGSRTYDIGVLSMRLAGFEIRDSLMWLYGSGFPKSLNVRTAIDRALDRQRTSSSKTVKARSLEKRISEDVANEAKRFDGWGSALKPAHEPIVLARKPLEGTIASNMLSYSTGGLNIDGCRVPLASDSDKASFAYNNEGPKRSRKADGAILGAYEGGWRVQKSTKPLPAGRFPANVLLTHHPDCIPIGTKVVGKGPVGGYDYTGVKEYNVEGFVKKNKPNSASNRGSEVVEHWQCHKDCPVAVLDRQSVLSKSSGDLIGTSYGGNRVAAPDVKLGGASRFFYCSKASRKDRDSGLENADPCMEHTAHSKRRSACLARCAKHDAPLPNGSTTYKCGCSKQFDKTQTRRTPQKNTHPTVKPFALMRYLCRLITPKNGIVLDLYMGSGSTGRAAVVEGFRFIGMESNEEYFAIALRRVSSAAKREDDRGRPD